MAKIKKISISAQDKVLDDKEKQVTLDWFGNSVVITKTLSLKDMLEVVEDVATSCFAENGEYHPEVKDFAIKVSILTKYANFSLPNNIDHKYDLIYNNDIVEVVVEYINKTQFDALIVAIDKKIDYICNNNIAALTKQIEEFSTALDKMSDQMSNTFSDVSPSDISSILSSMSNNSLDYNTLVKAYIENNPTEG